LRTLPVAAVLLWMVTDAPMAAEPAATAPAAPKPAPETCASANTRIVGPRTRDRPLPLLSGDAAHGFRPACSVRWGVLSPKEEPLPVEACYRGSLLQIVNHQVCPAVKGNLWVAARWVVTTADPTPDRAGAVACQHLETLALAATRALPPPCTPAADPGPGAPAPANSGPPSKR
jgi:hypothetical protein